MIRTCEHKNPPGACQACAMQKHMDGTFMLLGELTLLWTQFLQDPDNQKAQMVARMMGKYQGRVKASKSGILT